MRIQLRRPLWLLPLAAVLVSCAAFDTAAPEPVAVEPVVEVAAPEDPVAQGIMLKATADSLLQRGTNFSAEGVAGQALEATQPEGSSGVVLYRGNDQLIKMPELDTPVKVYGDDVTLNFEQAPLTEVIHAIMGDILELDYFVEHPIDGQVTLRTRTPVPRAELLGILESLLQSNRALMLRDDKGRYFISASGQMSSIRPGVSNPDSQGAGYSTIIIPLKFIGAANMAEILQPVANEAAFVRVDTARNLLMLAGTRSQLDGWLDLVATFDVDVLKGMSVGIFPLEHSSVEDIDMALAGLLGRTVDSSTGEGGGGSGIGSLVRIIPVERLNSILVVTPRAVYLDRLELWIERLDRAPDSNFESRLYVYPVQNSNASRLAELLSSIFAESGGSTQFSGSSSYSGLSPGLTPETVTGTGSAAAGALGAGRPGNRASLGGSKTDFVVGETRVVADEENNALLIYATGKEYRKIESALKKLDVVATQVIIEASILEVSLTDDLRYGLEWTFKGGLGDNYDGAGSLINAGRNVAAIVPGFSYTVTNSIGDISAVLNALAEESLVNVISTPSVMVLDNHTASIHVGDQVPVETSATITDGGNTIQSIEFRDTGVKLSVTPSVNAGGMVVMDVSQSVTDVGTIDVATGQRSFLERNIESRVAVRSNESVVLGGLIRENTTSGSSGIPGLHKIPVVGALFGTKSDNDRRTELLVIITPRVIFNEADLREVSREMRSRMREFELIDESSSSQLLSAQPRRPKE